MLRFSDGINIDTSGELRLLTLHDGDYVVGEGMLIPVSDKEKGLRIIREHLLKKEIDK
jgi:hypothetical protein